MNPRIIRFGNALRVEIPEEIAAQMSLSAGDLVEWNLDDAGRPQISKSAIGAEIDDQIPGRDVPKH